MVLSTANLTVEMGVGSQLSTTVSEGGLNRVVVVAIGSAWATSLTMSAVGVPIGNGYAIGTKCSLRAGYFCEPGFPPSGRHAAAFSTPESDSRKHWHRLCN